MSLDLSVLFLSRNGLQKCKSADEDGLEGLDGLNQFWMGSCKGGLEIPIEEKETGMNEE